MSNKWYQGIETATTPASNLGGNSISGVYTLDQLNTGTAIYGQQVQRSVRFRSSGSAYLNRTPASAGNQTTWTWSGWVKRGGLGAAQSVLFFADSTTSNYAGILFASDVIEFVNRPTAGINARLITTQVFRDPSAWYHIVGVWDSSNATSGDRVRLYVNGTRVTAFSTATYPSINTTSIVNTATAHEHGSYVAANGGTPAAFFDGYLAEVNFIDGQALDPSYFGQYGSETGVWQPKKYQGAYGTNGFYLPFTNNTAASTYYGSFNGSSQYLSVPSNSAWAIGTTGTVECWAYPTAWGTNYRLWSVTNNTTNLDSYLDSSGKLGIHGGSILTSNSVPLNTWTHIAVVYNSGTISIYFNGVAQSFTGTATGWNISSTGTLLIGSLSGSYLWQGSLSNLRIVKGTAVYTANFTPPTSPLTAISGTQLLTLQNATIVDNSTNAFTITNVGSVTTTSGSIFATSLGADYSGNGNNWTSNNISLTAGSTYDSMIDVPTNWVGGDPIQARGNYAVLNPLQTGSYVTGSNANLTITGNTATDSALSLSSIGNLTAGKWYWEYTQGTVGSETCGAMLQAMNGISLLNGESTTNSYGIGVRANGAVYGASKTTATITSWTTGDVIGIAVDIDNGAAYWSKNGTWLNSGVPTSGASKTGAVGAWTPSSSVVVTPSFGAYSSGSVSATFGQRPFAYTPPSGYKSLCTQNLPIPTTQKGNIYMDATLYTGAGAAQSIVNSGGFQPDLVWLKSRSNAYSHYLYDSVRGVTDSLSSDSTAAEQVIANTLTSFNSNGFSLGSIGGAINGAGSTFVGWQWKAGGTAVTNTAGSITSQVNANTTAGFSVVTFTTQSSGTGTVGHGLGVAPSMMILKVRNAVNGWPIYHISTGTSGYLLLNSTVSKQVSSNAFTGVSSTTFTLGTDFAGGLNYVAYCFAAIPGYSAFGSYTGNGSADGPFVYLGFRPRFILRKGTVTAGVNWSIIDTSRNTYNAANSNLYPNLSDAEGSSGDIDITSNGFKCRSSSFNTSGEVYIYAAFAENPFKYSLAR